MKINLELIKSFDPCREGLDNFIEHHKDFNGSELELLDLDNVNVSDKLWLLLREEFIPENDLHELACIFVESVLHIFEEEYPNDDRPRKAIEAKKKFIKGEISSEDLVDATEAAWAAARAAAWAAAWAAGAAASVAAGDAAWDAANAAAGDAAWAAARDAASAADRADGRAEEEQKQLEIVKNYFKQIGETE